MIKPLFFTYVFMMIVMFIITIRDFAKTEDVKIGDLPMITFLSIVWPISSIIVFSFYFKDVVVLKKRK